MNTTLLVQCLLIVAASVTGGVLADRVRLTHNRLQLIMSFVGGLMLGIALLHLLPHAATQLGSFQEAGYAALAGLVLMFLLLRTFHFHEHEPLDPGHLAVCGHEHDHDRDVETAPAHAHAGSAPMHKLTWSGVALGLSLHTLLDGMALAAAVQADRAAKQPPLWAGLGAFLAIALHKPLDALSITSLMRAGGWSPRARVLVNGAFALMCPLGALLFGFGVQQFSGIEGQIVGSALGFSAGLFLCISMSDLLPEIEFHTHDRLPLTLALLSGVVLAAVVSFLPA